MASTEDKVRENRLRRMAERRGLKVMKSRRRDPGAMGYGIWYLIEVSRNIHVGEYHSLDNLEHYLNSYWHPKAAA